MIRWRTFTFIKTTNMKHLLIILAMLVATTTATAQTPDYTSDTESIESILAAGLDCISVPQGGTADWARFENLFLPDAHLIMAYEKGDSSHYYSWSVKDFQKIAAYGAFAFEETALDRTINQFGNVAVVYEPYRAVSGDLPAEFGVNCYHLIYHSNRWWIATLSWMSETSTVQLPETLKK